MLGTFPARGMVAQWLKAGVVEQGRLHRTEDGVPQGGVVSPLLLNVALHGMEQAAGVRYDRKAGCGAGLPGVIRYADDLVALCHTRQDAFEVKAKLANWLASRGLALNEDKTRVVTLGEGFDFLGFNVRRYGAKTLIKPSKAAVRRIRERLRTELRSLRGTNAQTVIKKLNPIIRGWATYYRTQVSSEIFGSLDQYLWELTWKWAKFSHPNKPNPWVCRQVLRQVQQGQAGPMGIRRPPQRRLHEQVRLDQHRPTPDRQDRRHPMTPRLPITGHGDDARRPCRSTRPPRSSPTPRTAAARSAGTLLPADDRPQTPRDWEYGWRPPASDHQGHHPGGRRAGRARTPSHTR